MKKIHQVYEINASPGKVWKALTNAEDVEGWTGAKAEMDDKEGTKFKIWGDQVIGENIEVVKEKKLVQNWISGKWDKPSVVTFDLEDVGGLTKVEVTQVKMPEKECDDLEKGWRDYYMIPLKKWVEGDKD